MKKRFSLLMFFLVIFAFYLFGEEYNFYSLQMGGLPFYADLSGSSHTFDGTLQGSDWDKHYYDEDIVGILGVARNSENGTNIFEDNTFTITYSLDSVTLGKDKWVYTSQSDVSNQIPFGLDFVVRYNTWENTQGVTHKTYHLGYGYDGQSRGDGDDFKIETSSDWAAFWFDIILVVPDKKYWKTNFGPASDFQVDLRLTVTDTKGFIIKEEGGESFPLTLRGYYEHKSDDQSNSYVVFTVTPNAIAMSIPLSTLSGGEIQIGNFAYKTSPIMSAEDTESFKDPDEIESPLYMFVSSSDKINSPSPGDYFYLKHEKADANNNEDAIRIPFQIGLRDSKGEKWFDGTADSSSAESLQGQFTYSATRKGYYDIVNLHDEGAILFKLGHDDSKPITNEMVLTNYVSGRYQATIYIHLYSAL